jgi:hypothetical protein
MRAMFVARLICSDPECPEERAVEAATVAELEALACECGCALEIVGWPDWADEDVAEAIVVRLRRGSDGRPVRRAA